jgi:Ribose/xylose/arabinose/galactoside ABC-type transport systems, permease components
MKTPSQPPEDRDRLALQHVLNEFAECDDLVHREMPELQVHFVFIDHLIGNRLYIREIEHPFSNVQADEVGKLLKRTQYEEVTDSKVLIKSILEGYVAIFHDGNSYVVFASELENRAIAQSETESVITGPHDAFVESSSVNLSLIRRRVKSSHLKVVKLAVGEVTKNNMYIVYIKDIANQAYVDELIERIKRIEIAAVHDGNMLVQLIDDNSKSIFPQFITSERPDSAASKLVAGRVVGILDGSPSIFTAPSSIFEFFSSPDDYYQRWALGTATRVLRFIAFVITIAFTAFYVSVTTYHYEMIPEALLMPLTESRSRVPFPPIIEALIMEVTIELLREAGARLPSKIGQTIGIVGGIVIGQAAVQAGLTSNILIIAVASSAIASFVIPSYIMSASIRLIRFGLIVLAGIWGNLGLVMGIALIVIHISGLTSLGASYMTPVAPLVVRDWKDSFIRAPFRWLSHRPSESKSPNKVKQKMRQ